MTNEASNRYGSFPLYHKEMWWENSNILHWNFYKIVCCVQPFNFSHQMLTSNDMEKLNQDITPTYLVFHRIWDFFGWQLIRQEEEFRGGKMVSLKLACSSWVQSWRQFGRGLETVAGGLTPNGGNLDGLESDSCEAAATALQGHPTIKRGPTHLLFCYTDCSFYS